jgi:hypothetical protein
VTGNQKRLMWIGLGALVSALGAFVWGHFVHGALDVDAKESVIEGRTVGGGMFVVWVACVAMFKFKDDGQTPPANSQQGAPSP